MGINSCIELKYCPGWIRSTLRHPNKGRRVLVTLKNGRLDIDTYIGNIVGNYAFYKWDEVVAWQYAPAPYIKRRPEGLQKLCCALEV